LPTARPMACSVRRKMRRSEGRASRMTRISIVTIFVLALTLKLPAKQRGAGPAPAAPAASEATPRLADGHPDFSGVWWTGGDVGGRGFNAGGGGEARGAA